MLQDMFLKTSQMHERCFLSAWWVTRYGFDACTVSLDVHYLLFHSGACTRIGKSNFFFFEKGKAQKGLELHSYHIRWGYKVNTGPERNENY
jgi:hypothetical protein